MNNLPHVFTGADLGNIGGSPLSTVHSIIAFLFIHCVHLHVPSRPRPL